MIDQPGGGRACPGILPFADGKVVVPNGRSMPVRFNPETGELPLCVAIGTGIRGDRNGTLLFVGEKGVVSLRTAARWAIVGCRRALHPMVKQPADLFEGLFYKFMAACDIGPYSLAAPYGMGSGSLHGWDVAKAETSLYEKKSGNLTIHPARWDAPPLWKPVQLAKGGKTSTRVIAKAGSRIYTHVDNAVFALEASKPGAQPVVAWKKHLPGKPSSMIVADGRLFVVQEDGKLMCFGAEKPHSVQKHQLAKTSLAKSENPDEIGRRAERVLAAVKQDGGYALVVGLESGRLVEELARSKMKVVAVDADAEKINSLRRRSTQAGIYGVRFEGIVADPKAIKLPPYFASLIVSETSFEKGGVKPLDLYRVLRPYGGVLLAYDVIWNGEVLSPAKLPGAGIWQKGNLTGVQKDGALEGAADWTHESGDARPDRPL